MILAALASALLVTAAPACPAGDLPPALLCRAVGESDAGRFEPAATLFEQAAAASPADDPRTRRMLAAAGNMWIAAAQPGRAALALDRALAGAVLRAEERGLALLDRARAAEAQGDLAAARRFVGEASPSFGNDPFLLYFSAALAIREGDLKLARTAINQALAAAPDMAEVLFEAGHVAHAEGNTSSARDYWTRAAAADPGGPIAAAAGKALALLAAPPAPAATAAPAAR